MKKYTPKDPEGKPCTYCGRPVYADEEFIATQQGKTRKTLYAHRDCAYPKERNPRK